MSKEIEQYWENYHPPVTRAEEVLETQRRVMASLDSPWVKQYIYDFMKNITDVAYEHGGVKEVNLAMSSLFWPAANDEQMRGLLRKELFTARTYQVTADMVDAVTGTYFNTSKHIGHLEQEEPPSEAGFVWLDKPFLATDSKSSTIANRAISWSPVTVEYRDVRASVPGVRLNAWLSPYDHDDYWTEAQQVAYQTSGSPLLLAHTSTIPYGTRFGGHPEAGGFDMTPDDFAHWVHVLWMFMQTEIVTVRDAPLPRVFRRRAEKSFKFKPQVNVIMLRRIAVLGEESEEHQANRKIDWTCQWVVQGHHRHLDRYDGPKHHASPAAGDRSVCFICGVVITWVKPYIKGPEGLPLRSAEQLYRLAR